MMGHALAHPQCLTGAWLRRGWRRLMLAVTAHDDADLFLRSDQAEDGVSAQPFAGDFEAFFQRFAPQISGYLWRMLGEEQTAYDLCQETFLRAWERFAEIRNYPHPASWLFRVATNLALNAQRRQSAPVGAAKPLDDLIPDAGDFTVHHAEREMVRQILQALPAKPRALLVLREVYGLSCEEAAAILGMTNAAARKMLSRARADFRQRYLRKDGQA
jgi:RNA polymerase sigma-70 factor (ECF subfamily)